MKLHMANNRIVELKEEVFRFVQKNGPTLPSEVAKSFKGTNLFMSALLSELITNKKLKLTKAKVGGSPLYYAQGQEIKLYNLLREHVGQKPREALDGLKEKKVLRDRDCLPFERVALRELLDFAKPVRLVVQDTEELFWKWFLLSDSEAKDHIEIILDNIYNKKEEEKEEVKEEIKEEPKEEVKLEPETPNLETGTVELESIKEEVKVIKEEPKKKTSIIKKPQKKTIKKKVETKELDQKDEVQKKLDSSDKVAWDIEDEFLDHIKKDLEKRDIKIINIELVKKGREANLIVLVPSNVGELRYFIKARKKKKLTEGDILLGYTEGQEKKLPMLFLSNAKLSNKAYAYMEKNLPGMIYITVDGLE